MPLAPHPAALLEVDFYRRALRRLDVFQVAPALAGRTMRTLLISAGGKLGVHGEVSESDFCISRLPSTLSPAAMKCTIGSV